MSVFVSGCKHNLKDLMFRDAGHLEFIGLKFCTKCRKIFKETLQEIPY